MIRSYYRPIIRKIRLSTESFHNKASYHVNESKRGINNYFARFGFS